MSTSLSGAFSNIFSGIGSNLAQQPSQTFLGTQGPGIPGTGPLPALRTGGEMAGSQIDAALRPYLQTGLQRAEQLFFGQPQPSLYPGQMFVDPSQQTLDALARQEEIARGGQGILAAGQGAYEQALGGLGATAGGAFLGGNPFRDQMIQSALRPLSQQYSEQVVPGIASQFSAAGRYGSGAMQQTQSRAAEGFARGMGDIASGLAFQDYSSERARQQQAQALQAQLGAQAPQFYASQFLPSEQLAQIGASREAIAAKPLQEDISRFQFQQQLPYSQLQSFLSAVYGNPMAGSQVPAQAPAQTSRLGSSLGGAAIGAGIGQMTGGSLFGIPAPLAGAGIGGLLGGFF
jgi:hypothetical protein